MNSVLSKSSEYVIKLLREKLPGELVYHNFDHTIEVVDASKEIGENSGLTQDEMDTLLIAAWFHDTGFINAYEGHEEKSVEICQKFLEPFNLPTGKIQKISNAILATKLTNQPTDLIEQVLCDADISHIGKKGFKLKSKLLREEWENALGKKFSDFEWIKSTIDFISEKRFTTNYAKNIYEEQRKLNLEKLQKKLRKELSESILNNNKGEKEKSPMEKEKPLEDSKIKKDKQVERGIETMFRNTLRTHVEFSGMADNKANIMISVNTLLLTAIIAILARKLDSNPHLIFPTIVITCVSLVTLIFATLVTRPKITSGTFTAEDIKQKRSNLLFFGNFYKMDLKDFQWGMTEMMSDRDYLYGSMIKDFYYLGQVLGQKYRYLRICYNIFMYGLIISVIAFAIAIVLYPGQTEFGPLID